MKRKILYCIIAAVFLILFSSCASQENDGESAQFGGSGGIRGSRIAHHSVSAVFEDDDYIYFIGGNLLNRMAKNTGTVSVACSDPGCPHISPVCTARCHSKIYACSDNRLFSIKGNTVYEFHNDGETELVYENNNAPKDLSDEIYNVYAHNDKMVVMCGGYLQFIHNNICICINIENAAVHERNITFIENGFLFISNDYKLTMFDYSSHSTHIVLPDEKVYYYCLDGDSLLFTNSVYDLKYSTFDGTHGSSPYPLHSNVGMRLYVINGVVLFESKGTTYGLTLPDNAAYTVCDRTFDDCYLLGDGHVYAYSSQYTSFMRINLDGGTPEIIWESGAD